MPDAEVLAAPAVEFDPIVLLGTSAAARRLQEALGVAAGARCALVEGESGLEFADIARAVHRRSGRGGSCVSFDGSAGEAASFDAAVAEARGGTLFVGELPALSASVQQRLSQAIRIPMFRQTHTTSLSVPPAFIASLCAGDGEPGQSRVRRDLIRRFAEARIQLPPLRARAEDLPVIARAVVERTCAVAGIPHKALTEPALTLVAAMPWRGNLLELRAALARVVGAAAGDHIDLADVLAQVRLEVAAPPHPSSRTLRAARRHFEREYIQTVLRHQGGRVGEAARVLGMQRTNLYRKARQLGISVTRPEQA